MGSPVSGEQNKVQGEETDTFPPSHSTGAALESKDADFPAGA